MHHFVRYEIFLCVHSYSSTVCSVLNAEKNDNDDPSNRKPPTLSHSVCFIFHFCVLNAHLPLNPWKSVAMCYHKNRHKQNLCDIFIPNHRFSVCWYLRAFCCYVFFLIVFLPFHTPKNRKHQTKILCITQHKNALSVLCVCVIFYRMIPSSRTTRTPAT